MKKILLLVAILLLTSALPVFAREASDDGLKSGKNHGMILNLADSGHGARLVVAQNAAVTDADRRYIASRNATDKAVSDKGANAKGVQGKEVVGTIGNITLESESLLEGNVRVDVMVNDLNQPLLGLGFHLLFDMDLLEYFNYEPGEVLEEGGDQPIYLVKNIEDQGKIIVGASLKRGDLLSTTDGRVMSLFFREKNAGIANFDFENPIVSSLIEEKRVDLNDVYWENLQMPLTGVGEGGMSFFKGDLRAEHVLVVFGAILLIMLVFFYLRIQRSMRFVMNRQAS